MTQYGLIGKSLRHSFSPAYFARKFAAEGLSCEYAAFELESINLLPGVLEAHPLLKGLNVTIPYKESVMDFLEETDEAAAAIGAVNCISIDKGKLKGFNTDWLGFARSAESLLPGGSREGLKALVFGTGGASKGVRYALDSMGIPYLTVSRGGGGDLRYADLDVPLLQDYLLLVNTTPVGMYPQVEAQLPIPLAGITPSHMLYDLIYNPETTAFMRAGLEKGAAVKNGLEMLYIQAEESWKIWQYC